MTTRSYVQDPTTGKLVPKEDYVPANPHPVFDIMPAFEPFTSQIDKRRIRNRDALRAHNKEHGVTNIQDYGKDWFTRKAKERQQALTSPKAKQQRRRAIVEAALEHQYKR